ncbi:hypothetical protein DXT91_20345 [Agrobacterium tumefaciens]|jgi:hypothetical protein|uniref:hypothetical protein n=1 Tax=Agrobacterium tumefaciens TaxID=358 RepID=UPI000DDAEA4A|nr:hypothetical protein [Agrobacterium tumefaciens]MQB06446.1 hypothetical protein [Agrobacterium tumefaciens]NSY50370.1 hypothetical protein [Agrobacterium tumefaciens]
MTFPHEPYAVAQLAMSQLKSAIYLLLKDAKIEGMKNSEIGRSLGIYTGHVDHEGHIPRTLLSIMEAEGVVEQNKETKLWSLKKF